MVSFVRACVEIHFGPGLLRIAVDTYNVTGYIAKRIKRIRHRGLRKLYEDDTPRGLNADHLTRLPLILAALDAAESPGDMDIAVWRLHSLKGTRKGQWSVWVSENWRVTVRFDGTNATDVNYEDYH